jgi:hypothetical protein
MPSLAQLLNDKITKDALAVTAAAKKAGISFPSFHAALHGKSVPNARSVDKYASFLGITTAEVQAASGKAAKPAKAAKGSVKKAKKAAKAAKGSVKKAKKAKKVKKAGRRGRPPGSKNKAAAKAAKAASSINRKALAALSASLKKATALLSKLA